ncbi:MAG: cyclase family protein [Gemmatimonadetes bacterium]|nr:cyclase family protein [Gemmatimonadota bacterium]
MNVRLTTSVVVSAVVMTLGLGGATMVLEAQDGTRAPRNLEEFDVMFRELSNWGRWGASDERGTLNLITPAKIREAAALVRSGITVSLSHNPMPEAAPDNPVTAFEHTMGRGFRSDTYSFTYHGYGVSHIDALCHFAHNGRLYNDVPTSASTSEGCSKNGIQNLKNGIVTRGILLDFPRLKGVPYLEPGTPIYIEDIEAWERQAAVTVSAGDVIFIRTGRWARREALGPWQLSGNSAGLHASVLPWIKERDVAFVGSDAATDVMPSMVEGITQPVHTFLIAGLGSNIFDNMDLEALAETAARLNRWEFMLTAGPIPVTGGTGSPLNPIAVF